MYLPAHFRRDDPAALARLVADHPLGMLVRQGPRGLDADHIPFEAAEDGRVLRAHVARANPLWSEAREAEPVLVVFRGPQAYVSPNSYPSKAEHHRHVPTWNYEVVHVHGTLRIVDDARFVRALVARLTREHEHRTDAARAWRMGDAPQDYIDGLLGAIVGIEVAVTRIEGKAKLGQNREERDRLGAADALEARGEGELARAMRTAGS